MIPISIGGAINEAAIWFDDVQGLALIDETKNNLNSGSPSKETLDRIENALNFTKKSDRLRRTFYSTILAIIVLVSASVLYANHFLKIAESRSLALRASRNIDINFDESLRLASDSYSTKEILESKGVLLEVLNYNPTLDYYLFSRDEFQTNGVFSPSNDSILITHGFNQEIRIWDLENKILVKKIQLSSPISEISFNKTGRVLVVGHLNGDVTIFPYFMKSEDSKLIQKIGLGRINSLIFISSNLFAFSSEEGISFYDITSAKKTSLSVNKIDRSSVLAYQSKDSTLIAKGAYDSISFWDISDFSNPQHILQEAYADIAYSITINSDENLVAIGYHDGTISVWDLNQKKNIGTFLTGGRVLAMQFLRNNQLLTSSDKGLVTSA